MNDQYLMQYISYHLHTYVRKYTNTGALLSEFCARKDLHDTPAGPAILPVYHSDYGSLSFPVFCSVNARMIYALIPADAFIFQVGPVCLPSSVSLKYTIQDDSLTIESADTIPLCEFRAFTTDVLLVYNLFHEEILEESSLLLLNCIHQDIENQARKYFSEIVFKNHKYVKKHNPYDQEIREFSSIENGDLEQLKQSHAEDYPGKIGTLSKDPVRHMKNLGIVVVTLASRAAIRGGLLPEVSFSLSDSYIQSFEECDDIATLFHLIRASEYHYAQMVRDLKNEQHGTASKDKNPHIQKCKDYVFAHLHEKISVQQIANELGLNANYLSELFQKCEHISLTKFIQSEKISLAKNLLIYSHYSYIEIAAYLGYSSQSHLGKQFKEKTGYTLRKYRETFGKKEFTW